MSEGEEKKQEDQSAIMVPLVRLRGQLLATKRAIANAVGEIDSLIR